MGVIVVSLALILTCMAATVPGPVPSDRSPEPSEVKFEPALNILGFENPFRSSPLDVRKPGPRHTLSIAPTVPTEQIPSNNPEANPTVLTTIPPPNGATIDPTMSSTQAAARVTAARADATHSSRQCRRQPTHGPSRLAQFPQER